MSSTSNQGNEFSFNHYSGSIDEMTESDLIPITVIRPVKAPKKTIVKKPQVQRTVKRRVQTVKNPKELIDLTQPITPGPYDEFLGVSLPFQFKTRRLNRELLKTADKYYIQNVFKRKTYFPQNEKIEKAIDSSFAITMKMWNEWMNQ